MIGSFFRGITLAPAHRPSILSRSREYAVSYALRFTPCNGSSGWCAFPSLNAETPAWRDEKATSGTTKTIFIAANRQKAIQLLLHSLNGPSLVPRFRAFDRGSTNALAFISSVKVFWRSSSASLADSSSRTASRSASSAPVLASLSLRRHRVNEGVQHKAQHNAWLIPVKPRPKRSTASQQRDLLFEIEVKRCLLIFFAIWEKFHGQFPKEGLPNKAAPCNIITKHAKFNLSPLPRYQFRPQEVCLSSDLQCTAF